MVRFLPLLIVMPCTLEDMSFETFTVKPSYEGNDILDRKGLYAVHIHEKTFLSISLICDGFCCCIRSGCTLFSKNEY